MKRTKNIKLLNNRIGQGFEVHEKNYVCSSKCEGRTVRFKTQTTCSDRTRYSNIRISISKIRFDAAYKMAFSAADTDEKSSWLNRGADQSANVGLSQKKSFYWCNLAEYLN